MSSSSTPPQWKHDVFVSFGEDDVIKNFISNLFKRLNQVGINYFKDDNREGAVQNKENRLNAIRQQTFAFALVVFSKNYVNSPPCMDELVEILNCKRDHDLVVVPIFYIDRAKVSERASDALATAMKISGYYELKAANSDESKLIDIIVERLVKEINSLYPTKDFGPFGGKGKKPWKSGDINGIDICYADFIKSIAFKVNTNTSSKLKNDGKSPFKVKLEEGEYISSFAGYFNNADNRINSLTFRTNQRIWGPFGREEGVYFSVPSKAGKVSSFFGTSDSEFLESIGGHVELHSEKFYRVQSAGLIGEERGPKWDDGRTHTNVKKIVVELDSSNGQEKQKEVDSSKDKRKKQKEVDSSNVNKKQQRRFIRSIEFTYEKNNGIPGEPKRHGSNTGQQVVPYAIELGANEYLTSISGYYTDAGITSLRFRTNKQMNRPIGEEEGTHFSSPATAGKIVGFYGFGDEHLCGIGAHFEPISDLHPVKSIGPFGDGYDWDDRKFDGVREIYLPDKHNIRYFVFVYDNGSEKGHTVMYPRGASRNRKEEKVDLDYPREYLTSFSGYTQGDGSISSLTFHSNKQRHGPFGKEEGTYFWYPSTGSRIIGFYGTWGGNALNSIGVYVEPIPHMYPFKIVTPFEGSGGTPWDDGVHTNVRGFRVTTIGPKGSESIESITFKYDDNGSLVEGSQHGRGDASSGEWEMLDFPKERLTRIEGYYMRVDGEAGQTIIHDLRIVTTKPERTPVPYAPRGSDKNRQRHFKIPKESKDGRIVGFFGMAGTHLNSIGARLEPYLIVGVLKKKALIHHGRRLKKNGDKKLQAFNEEELLKHEGKECQQRSLKSSPRIATLVYCIGFVWVLLLTWWTFLFFLI